METVLVTGATGFIGQALCLALAAANYRVRRAVRRVAAGTTDRPEPTVLIGSIDGATDWSEAVRGIGCVVHLAAPEGLRGARAGEALAEYHRVNVAGSARLGAQAAAAGVRRLVYMSTIKVNGEATSGRPFTEDDAPRPETPYGASKLQAEEALRALERKSGIEVVILRPPLVYGPAVRGNFLRLMKLVARGFPLPFGSVRNRRSMVYIGNLVDAILACVQSPAAAGRTFLVSDGEDVSTADLVRALASALGVAPRLFSVPPSILAACATLLGKREEAARLLGSLQVDGSRIRRELGWRPPCTREQGLGRTAQWYHSRSA